MILLDVFESWDAQVYDYVMDETCSRQIQLVAVVKVNVSKLMYNLYFAVTFYTSELISINFKSCYFLPQF